jgi:glutaminyl-peptide cyclotransferase
MHFYLKKVLSLSLATAIFISCNQGKKKIDNARVEQQEAPLVSLLKARYAIGDSISLGFPKALSKLDVQFDGKDVGVGQNLADTLKLNTQGNKTGWHQLIVRGSTKDKEDFVDTLRVELISDIVPVQIQYTVLTSYPHQVTSFTEGLEFYKGNLYEGTGQNGGSKLMKVDLKTGSSIKEIPLELKYFGEGITIVKDNIYQLTWQSGVCFRYDMNFKLNKTFTYYTQGWGMTHDGTTLIMSDGSSKIYFYNTEMEKVGEIDVYDQSGPVRNLNELEFVDGYIFANIFESTKIVKIDPKTGKVVGFMDMKSMVPANVNVTKDVLNGIAHQPFENALYVTGKNWPLLFKIKLTYPAKNKLALK